MTQRWSVRAVHVSLLCFHLALCSVICMCCHCRARWARRRLSPVRSGRDWPPVTPADGWRHRGLLQLQLLPGPGVRGRGLHGPGSRLTCRGSRSNFSRTAVQKLVIKYLFDIFKSALEFYSGVQRIVINRINPVMSADCVPLTVQCKPTTSCDKMLDPTQTDPWI